MTESQFIELLRILGSIAVELSNINSTLEDIEGAIIESKDSDEKKN